MKEQALKNKEKLSSKFIVSCITVAILSAESIWVLSSFFRKGFLKKEVLSTESDLGFDVRIIMKE